MANSTTIQARVDVDTKKKAKGILDALDISMSEAITMFLRQIIFHRGIPFDLKIPNDVTLETHEKAKAGKELHKVSSMEQLVAELNS